MRGSWIFLVIFGITASWGFSFERPVFWGKMPVIEIKPISSFEIDHVSKNTEVKKSIKPEVEMAFDTFSDNRFDLLTSETQNNSKTIELDDMKDDIIFPIEENSSFLPIDISSETPQNVVWLFVNESGLDTSALWTSLRTSGHFPVHGFLLSCQNEENLFRIPNAEYLSSKQNDQCECEKFLKLNIDSLLSWAHRSKKMATDAAEATHISIPLPTEHESPIIRPSFVESDEKKFNLDNEGLTSLPSTVSGTIKKEGDGISKFLDTFSKMRIALFRNWLESFHKNATDVDEFSSLKPISMESAQVELMGDTVDKLKSISNEKGFIMIADAPEHKINTAIEILEKEIAIRETLLVVSGICPKERKLIPFFARGPGSQHLYDAKTILDLPLALKKALSGCKGIWCQFQSLNPDQAADHDFHHRFARERHIRNAETSTTSNSVTEAAQVSNTTEGKNENTEHIHNHSHSVNSTMTESTIGNETSNANTTEHGEIVKRMLPTSKASGFSMKSNFANIGVASFVIAIFLNF